MRRQFNRQPPVAKSRGFGTWAGSQQNRLTGDWFATMQSANEELKWDLRTLRLRAREQERNNPHARRYLRIMVKNVVGSQGIRLEVQAETTRGGPHGAVNPKIEAAFAEWGRPEHCSANGQLGWVGLQALAIYTWARDGECFIRKINGFGNPFGFALQLIDSDQVDETYNVPRGGNQNRIAMGVEVDQWGRPVAYHVWTTHPSDTATVPRIRERIPADQVIHLHQPRRYGAVRGETALAPVLKPMRDLNGFVEAAVVNARVGASKMGFITKPLDNPGAEVLDSIGSRPMEASAGSIDELNPGEDFKSWDTQFPSNEFAGFNNALLHYIAAGLDVAAATLTGDLSQVNYSSIRAGLLDERDTYRQLQGWLIESLHDRVYRAWLPQAVTTGAVALPTKDITRWFNVTWRPRGWAWVDPLKEVNANALAAAYLFKSKSRIVAEDGGDYETVLAEQQHDKMMEEAAGLVAAVPSTVILPLEPTDGNETDPTGNGGRSAVAIGHGDRRPHLAIAAR